MKDDLIYKEERASTMMVYDYRIHRWCWDCKFYAVNGHWCVDTDGTCPIGEFTEKDLLIIETYKSIIQEREQLNKAFVKFNNCRRRSCICKQCNKRCHCADCTVKILRCDGEK